MTCPENKHNEPVWQKALNHTCFRGRIGTPTPNCLPDTGWGECRSLQKWRVVTEWHPQKTWGGYCSTLGPNMLTLQTHFTCLSMKSCDSSDILRASWFFMFTAAEKKLAAWEMQIEDFLWKNLCLAMGSECNQYAKPITPISILVVSVSMQGVPCGFCTREPVEIIPILLLLCTIPHMLEVHNLLPTVGKQNWRRNRKKGFMSQSCTGCYVTILANCDCKNGYLILSDLQTPSSLQHKKGSKPITPSGGLVLE